MNEVVIEARARFLIEDRIKASRRAWRTSVRRRHRFPEVDPATTTQSR